VIRARRPPDEGAVVLQALNAARDAESDDVTAVTSAVGDRFAQPDDLDYDIAIGELLSLQQKRLPPETITA
jgi:hypothetical protein